MKQGCRAQKFIFICHLKNAESEAKHQNYQCPVVLRSDIMKDLMKYSLNKDHQHLK